MYTKENMYGIIFILNISYKAPVSTNYYPQSAQLLSIVVMASLQNGGKKVRHVIKVLTTDA